MKIQIIKVGKPTQEAYESLAGMFAKRLKPIWKIEEHVIRASGADRTGRELYAKIGWSTTGQKLDTQQAVVVLDERGQDMSSPALAQYIQEKFDLSTIKILSLVIGGPYGLTDALRAQADLVWRLSHGIFPSDLAWVMVWEQLYRASSILRGSAYHHE